MLSRRSCLSLVRTASRILGTAYSRTAASRSSAGFLISAWLDAFVTLLPVRKLIGYGMGDQLRDVWKSGVSALLMAAAVYALGRLALPLAVKLAAQVLLGGAVYALFNLGLKNENLTYLLNTLRGLLHRRAAGN